MQGVERDRKVRNERKWRERKERESKREERGRKRQKRTDTHLPKFGSGLLFFHSSMSDEIVKNFSCTQWNKRPSAAQTWVKLNATLGQRSRAMYVTCP